ncbi:MAG: radical SAM protein [Holophagales bacterium]|nr:radical SAM protein [Holophagales bacterium]
MLPPPRPVEGVVSWNIGTACNYRCPYCTQRDKRDRTSLAGETEGFLAAFARLPGRWEVKLSGGEPFVHPELDAFVAGLARLGHRISVVTNLSASRERLASFVAAAQGRVGVFSASLHLPYVPDLDGFVGKARFVEELVRTGADPSLPRPSLSVTAVATRDALPGLPGLARRFADAGLTFKVQPEKQNSRVIPYSEGERELLLALGGHNLTGEIEHRYLGRPCWAGALSMILDDKGEAWRCYPARKARRDRLGPFLGEGFALASGPTPCTYETCHCTVPIARGMMARSPEETSHALQDL